MIYNLSNPYEREKLIAWVERMIEKGEVIEAKRKDVARTIKQNSYLHLIISYFASQYGCGADEAKIDFYKRACNRDLFERERTNKRGEVKTYLRSSADLTKEEMTLSIDRFRYWSVSVAGIYLPSKEDGEMLTYAMQEIERNKEFI